MPWLVLRPQPEADALVAVLRSRGVNALATPAIERIAVPLPRAVEKAISAVPGAARGVIALLTSAAAVPLVTRSPRALEATAFGALEPTTASAMRAAHEEPAFTSSGGAVELAHACVAYIRSRGFPERPLVVHPTSDAGLAREEGLALEHILAPVADLVRFPLYETRAHAELAASLRALSLGSARYVVASPSAVSALADVPHPRARAALCRGASTADAWRAQLGDECAPTLVDRSASLEAAIADYDAHDPA